VFRNVGIYNSDAGELPKRKYNIFRTRRKFEIKIHKYVDYMAHRTRTLFRISNVIPENYYW